MTEYVVSVRVSPDALESIESLEKAFAAQDERIEQHLAELSRPSPPSQLDVPAPPPEPFAGAIPGLGGEFEHAPAPAPRDPTPAPIRDYDRVGGGGAWVVSGDAAAVRTLERANSDIRVRPKTYFSLPAPEVTLMGEVEEEAAQDYHRAIIGLDDRLLAEADGTGVKIAIIDSGMDTTHPEFKKATFDRKHSFTWKAYDVVDCDIVPKPLSPNAKYTNAHFHGTAVAGALCGVTTGIAPAVSLLVHNIMQYDARAESLTVERAMTYSMVSTTNVDIVLMAVGTPERGPLDSEIEMVAVDAGKLLIVAAGNFGPGVIVEPAVSPNALTVGSTDRDDAVWPKTCANRISVNGGTLVKPDIYAPGVALKLPVPSAVDTRGYLAMSGTSFSAPIVAGVAALVLSWCRANGKSITSKDVIEHLLSTAQDIQVPGAFGPTVKRVDARRAIESLK